MCVILLHLVFLARVILSRSRSTLNAFLNGIREYVQLARCEMHRYLSDIRTGRRPIARSSVIPIDVMALFLLFEARSKALSAPKRLGGIAPEG